MYSLNSSAGTLVISFIGLQTQEVKIQPVIKVVLEADAEQLDEVMVVAYGTAKKSSFTGAAASVDGSKVLKDIPVTSFEQALAGSTPGLTINSGSGQPGAALEIRVREMGFLLFQVILLYQPFQVILKPSISWLQSIQVISKTLLC